MNELGPTMPAALPRHVRNALIHTGRTHNLPVLHGPDMELIYATIREHLTCVDDYCRKEKKSVNPFQAVKDFEQAVAEYTGAPYVVAVNSCSMALLLAVAWHLRHNNWQDITQVNMDRLVGANFAKWRSEVEIPKRTYLSVPMSIIHAGGRPTFRDENWEGAYPLLPLNVWDSARWFTSGLWNRMPPSYGKDRIPRDKGMRPDGVQMMICTSHHISKTLGDSQGGCILHDDPEADAWLRRARFDGRTEGVAPADDKPILGWHCYMSPDVATRLLWRLSRLPKHNAPLPNDPYPDLSTLEIFK